MQADTHWVTQRGSAERGRDDTGDPNWLLEKLVERFCMCGARRECREEEMTMLRPVHLELARAKRRYDAAGEGLGVERARAPVSWA